MIDRATRAEAIAGVRYLFSGGAGVSACAWASRAAQSGIVGQPRVHEGQHGCNRREYDPERGARRGLAGEAFAGQGELRVRKRSAHRDGRAQVEPGCLRSSVHVKSRLSVSMSISPVSVMSALSVSSTTLCAAAFPSCSSKLATPQRTAGFLLALGHRPSAPASSRLAASAIEARTVPAGTTAVTVPLAPRGHVVEGGAAALELHAGIEHRPPQPDPRLVTWNWARGTSASCTSSDAARHGGARIQPCAAAILSLRGGQRQVVRVSSPWSTETVAPTSCRSWLPTSSSRTRSFTTASIRPEAVHPQRGCPARAGLGAAGGSSSSPAAARADVRKVQRAAS